MRPHQNIPAMNTRHCNKPVAAFFCFFLNFQFCDNVASFFHDNSKLKDGICAVPICSFRTAQIYIGIFALCLRLYKAYDDYLSRNLYRTNTAINAHAGNLVSAVSQLNI